MLQVMGKLPTVSIEKTDGCQMYLSEKSLDTEIVSAKSSEMNISVPTSNGEFVSIVIVTIHIFKTPHSPRGML